MTKSDTNEELKALKKALRKEQRKNKTLEEKYNSVKHQNKILKCGNKKKAGELILSSLSEKEQEVVELLFPDTGTER
jgi:DNA-directed RNA polymerase specialized sigma subunit